MTDSEEIIVSQARKIAELERIVSNAKVIRETAEAFQAADDRLESGGEYTDYLKEMRLGMRPLVDALGMTAARNGRDYCVDKDDYSVETLTEGVQMRGVY